MPAVSNVRLVPVRLFSAHPTANLIPPLGKRRATAASIMWHYQTGNRLRPGDIVLLHFTPTLDKELVTVFAAAKEQNLQIGRLEDWLR
jgi:hypothetical protein